MLQGAGIQEALPDVPRQEVQVEGVCVFFCSERETDVLLQDINVVIGRSSACTIVINDDKKASAVLFDVFDCCLKRLVQVSREHCKVEQRGEGKWVVSDMGNTKRERNE